MYIILYVNVTKSKVIFERNKKKKISGLKQIVKRASISLEKTLKEWIVKN